MALVAVTMAYVVFARFALRPWLTRRLDGRDMSKASGPVAFAIIVTAGLAASLLGQAAKSTLVGLIVFFVVLSGIGTGVVLRAATRPPK